MPASITAFFGHFHPVLVHLPIGFLLAGLLLEWLSYREKYRTLRPAIPVILFWGAVAATISAITGYVLSTTDDYDAQLVGWHQWMGIAVAFTSWLLYIKERGYSLPVNKKILGVVLLLLILITGHLGGSLTHGSGYLTQPLSGIFGNDSLSGNTIKPLADVQEAFVYNDVIRPILQTKCYSCHGPAKQKGKLRMDDVQLLMKGGKDGKVIEPGNPEQSALIKRLLLPVDNEDHMPPKEKSQPAENQVALLHWWISNGADVAKKVKDIPQTDKIKSLLLPLQNAPVIKREISFVPVPAVEKGDEKVIEQLKEKGIVVIPVAQNSNYLSANFVTHNKIEAGNLRQLLLLKKQLIWLKLGFTNVADSNMAVIAQMTSLTRLSLDHTNVSDSGLVLLKGLTDLQYLNLVGTRITAKSILQLKNIKGLHSLFVYQAKINPVDWAELKKAFPGTLIDSGGYEVKTLPTDTTVVQAKKTE